jgi:hypothetical protein
MDGDHESCRLFGYGVYEGDHRNESMLDSFVDLAITMAQYNNKTKEEIKDELVSAGLGKNPRIKLDSGKIVWGCECWWGAEEEFKSNPPKIIIDVDIDNVRAGQTK